MEKHFYPLSKSAFINILNKDELIKIINESEYNYRYIMINIIFIDKNNVQNIN